MNADRLLAHYEKIADAPTRSRACAASFSIWPCGGSWWSRIRTMNRRRSC